MYSSTWEYDLSCLVIVSDPVVLYHIHVKSFKILFKKLLKRKRNCCPFFIFWVGSQLCMNEVGNGKEAGTITRHSNQYDTAWCWPHWGSWEMWHAELFMWCLLYDPLGPWWNGWWNSMNCIMWTAKYCTLFWDFFHSSHFMRRMVFYVFKCNIS